MTPAAAAPRGMAFAGGPHLWCTRVVQRCVSGLGCGLVVMGLWGLISGAAVLCGDGECGAGLVVAASWLQPCTRCCKSHACVGLQEDAAGYGLAAAG
jgi:hypothetical protein